MVGGLAKCAPGPNAQQRQGRFKTQFRTPNPKFYARGYRRNIFILHYKKIGSASVHKPLLTPTVRLMSAADERSPLGMSAHGYDQSNEVREWVRAEILCARASSTPGLRQGGTKSR